MGRSAGRQLSVPGGPTLSTDRPDPCRHRQILRAARRLERLRISVGRPRMHARWLQGREGGAKLPPEIQWRDCRTADGPLIDDIEQDVDAAIAACGGDLRATIRALLIANAFFGK